MFHRPGVILCVLCGALLLVSQVASAQETSLQERLLAEGAPALAKAAQTAGDPRRGAIVFHQPFLACAKCHTVGKATGQPLLGPDLTQFEKRVSAEYLIESVLDPSKSIRRGFEHTVVELTDGRTLSGLVVNETDEKLTLRDPANNAETTLAKADVAERTAGKTSIMPVGQVNALADRGQFLDLISYLTAVAEGGPVRAAELQPSPSLFAVVVPEYEKEIDHAGLLRDLNEKSYQRGEAIYLRLCINCHGTKDQPGSLPTSLKFAEGKFKNGSDPFRMYQTLTHGFGFMTPQTWMVPQQKYDVIHYVREAYLKPHNSSQYTAIDAKYLESLPKGTTRGPAPSNVELWSSMNYGPFLTATYEVGKDGTNFAQKGIAVRLDPGPGGVSRGKHWQVFDHDTLRVAAVWSATPRDQSNFIDWHGINFDGRHGAWPHVSGQVQFAVPTGPGWANPETGSFDDPRIVGRDQKRYGPLPREWGRFRGLYQFGDQAILSYTIGDATVLEMAGVVTVDSPGAPIPGDGNADSPGATSQASGSAVFTRTFQIGPRTKPMLLKVATHPLKKTKLEQLGVDRPAPAPATTIALLSPSEKIKEATSPQTSFHGRTRIDVEKSHDFNLTNRDFSITARIKTRSAGTILSQPPLEGDWAPDGKSWFIRGGRLTYDIGWVGAVTGKTQIADDRWHDVAMTWSHDTAEVRLFVDGKLDGQGKLKPKALSEKQTIRVGFTSPDFPDPTFFVGQIDDVRFFQRRLTDEEAKAGPPEKDEQLVARWKPGIANGDLVRDETGRGHDGQVTGGFGPAPADERQVRFAAGLSPAVPGATWRTDDANSLLLSLPAGSEPLKFVLSVTALRDDKFDAEALAPLVEQVPFDLASLTHGGPRRWPEELTTEIQPGDESGPFAVDVINAPTNNPWLAQLRLTGFDFFPDGDRLAICSWDGDLWLVSGLSGKAEASKEAANAPSKPIQLKWRRIANGLFQPLGLKIVNDQIYVTCRDQLALLRDLNGDDEIDFIECFNNDHQVTEHFHEFAMGLQTDAAGNFYYAKSARHGLPAVVPQHGTLLRVSADGSRTDVLANGFRAANGVCLNPDGSFVVTDQEGHWNPKNRINWVTPAGPGEPPHFYGNMFGYHERTDASDEAMEQPLCWITNAFDRSPAELLWVESDRWGPLNGSLLNLSYGYGKVFVVPFEKADPTAKNADPSVQTGAVYKPQPVVQGGMCELPIPSLPTGVMRGRFNPQDGQLYVCGMFAWAGQATQPGGFYRIRATGRPMHLPTGLKARKKRLELTFSDPLDSHQAGDKSHYTVRTWSLKRSANYGSKHYDEKELEIRSVEVSADGRTVAIELPDLQPTWGMSIEYKLKGSQGERVDGLIHNTIHWLGE